MKKFLKTLMVALPLGLTLTGCEDATIANQTKDLFTPQEWSMIRVFDNTYHVNSYDRMFLSVQGLRSEQNPENTGVPFCDVVGVLESIESKFHNSTQNGRSILAQWEAYKGEQLRISCNKMLKSDQVDPVVTPIEQVQDSEVMQEKEVSDIKEATIVVDNTLLLKPEQIRELRITVKDCRRAQNKMIDILGANEDLTVQHYEDVTKLVIQCERTKLESELNFN